MSAKPAKREDSPAACRILLVDDHPLLRAGLAQRLSQEPDLMICGQASDGYQAMETARDSRPDLMVVDLSLPDRDGIDMIKELRTRFPKLPVLVFSMHDESLYAERALRAGAQGYVMKNEPPERLISAIRRVLAGEIVVGGDLVSMLLHRVAKQPAGGSMSILDLLTDKELEIYRKIGQGHSRSRIAAELNRSVKTIEAHRANIRRKLGLNSSTELLRHAMQFLRDESGPRHE